MVTVSGAIRTFETVIMSPTLLALTETGTLRESLPTVSILELYTVPESVSLAFAHVTMDLPFHVPSPSRTLLSFPTESSSPPVERPSNEVLSGTVTGASITLGWPEAIVNLILPFRGACE
jgi:hypothetical protein